MKRPSAFIALAALFFVQGSIQAQEQDAPEQDAQGQESFEPGVDGQSSAEQPPANDPNDFWSGEPLPEEQTAGEEGIFDPPGLPMIDPADVPEAVEGGDIPNHGSFGGTEVGDGVAPWQAQLYYPELTPKWQAQVNNQGVKPWLLQHRCGGVLVARYWVLTAAHCVNGISMDYRIRLGREQLDQSGGWDYKIGRIIINEGRNPADRYARFQGGDIALIFLVNDNNQIPPVSQVRKVTLAPNVDPATGSVVTAYGWGMRNQGGDITSAPLLSVDVNVIDRTTCAKAGVAKIDNRVICASFKTRKTCKNDSGGPVLNRQRQLVGIVSGGGTYCGPDNVPSVYTRVAHYLPWIKAQTGGAVQ
jgi:V8-like Glu-specific endopeptidase